jgi:hypothetical protein
MDGHLVVLHRSPYNVCTNFAPIRCLDLCSGYDMVGGRASAVRSCFAVFRAEQGLPRGLTSLNGQAVQISSCSILLIGWCPQQDQPAPDFRSRERLCELRAVGGWNAVRSVPGSDTTACRAIRGLGACWAVIPGEIPVHPVRHLSLRSAVAAGACDARLHCAVPVVEPAQLLAPGAGAAIGRRAGRDRTVRSGFSLRSAPFQSFPRSGRCVCSMSI